MSGLETITVNGVGLIADSSGALFWPQERCLVAADLHLEKGSAYAKGGQLLPPYDTAATLQALEQLLDRYRPARVIVLGDSFHDRTAEQRMAAQDCARLQSLVERQAWTWIIGNHDPEPGKSWGGEVLESVTIGALTFRHEAQPRAVAGEISGHFHPKARVQTRVRRISGRCFVGDGRRLILPAFGAYAGGLDVLNPAIASLFEARYSVHLLARGRLWPFPHSSLVGVH